MDTKEEEEATTLGHLAKAREARDDDARVDLLE
jgi:hypothetical protein